VKKAAVKKAAAPAKKAAPAKATSKVAKPLPKPTGQAKQTKKTVKVA